MISFGRVSKGEWSAKNCSTGCNSLASINHFPIVHGSTVSL
jgi:hypothetical protein